MRLLIPLLLLAAFSCAAAPVADYDPLRATADVPVPHSVPVPGHQVSPAWAEAKRLLGEGGITVPAGFLPPLAVRVREIRPTEGGRFLGFYLASTRLTKQGRMVMDERVVLYLPEDCLVHEVLVHEFIHSLHARLNHVNPKYRGMDPEYFVAHFYPQRATLPACP